MSGYHSFLAVDMIFILIMPAAMFHKTTVVLIQILNKFRSFHVLFVRQLQSPLQKAFLL